MSPIASGYLSGGLPFDRLGSGPRDVVVFPGISFENKPASRMAAGTLLGPFRFLERHFTVHVVYRRPRLPRGSTIADLADDYAAMIRTEFGDPVDLIGVSTGGSIAQQLAVDHPELVRRLVLFSTAHRLGDAGRRFQRRQAELANAGRWGTAMAEGMALILLPRRGLGRWLTLPVRWFLALLGALVPKPSDPSDFVTTVEAEDAFDLGSRLGEIRAPTLVVAGARDPFYSPELFRATAAGIPGARLVLDPRGGHVPTGERIARAILGFLGAKGPMPETEAAGALWYEREAVIKRPPERVFDFCSDLRNELVWNPDARSVEKLTDSPVGVGTRFRARWARTRPTLVEVVRFDRPRSWTTHSMAMGMGVTATGMVEEHPDGTLYRVRLEVRPAGLSRLLAPLAVRMMERQEGRNMARISGALESADSFGAGSTPGMRRHGAP